jgi:hypothetical protein
VLVEYGLVVERRLEGFRKALPLLLEEAGNGLGFDFRTTARITTRPLCPRNVLMIWIKKALRWPPLTSIFFCINFN